MAIDKSANILAPIFPDSKIPAFFSTFFKDDEEVKNYNLPSLFFNIDLMS